MTLSNYPPGVSGNEWEIAGPDVERDETRYCQECADDREGLTQGLRGAMTWECSSCGWTEEWDALDEVDWDMLAEEAREMREMRAELGWDD